MTKAKKSLGQHFLTDEYILDAIVNTVNIENKVILHNGDLHDLNSLINVVNVVRPDRVFHLAGQSYVMDSFNQPAETLSLNIIGTVNLLDSNRYFELDPLIHICSSSEVYGQVNEDELIEVTPSSIRLRKKHLKEHERKKVNRLN